jgi:membrane-bound inhibitor of C-type lysozyme
LLAACGVETTPSKIGPSDDKILATFVCPDGTEIPAEFDNAAGTVTITLSGESLTLPRAESASGARYSDGSNNFWNKGDEALVEVDGKIVYEGCVTQD